MTLPACVGALFLPPKALRNAPNTPHFAAVAISTLERFYVKKQVSRNLLSSIPTITMPPMTVPTRSPRIGVV